ncbi:methylated-DNA--[protein]-cysteine S-methyltransferase [Microbacterium sp. NIBRBAC000506063]|uniref:methylated-DNA--[protein]-cysteine S-methyltransferase n=1 Tax=Microbacterium sp. NIBRBAC000506063 TaxID=2734618 RepID=UPI001BB6F822|nr:methylated-DNA--[protein]-cysteine S-methyltransferase [Microbacterium sp. NIBRBAC000506063]QTV79984.1 methylated-DNA--[protein]-cysteine S-methyltransferase [Microbacterium sp. NIBRBAC000506063]
MTYRYDFVPTPFGDALAVFSDDGIVRFDLSEAEDPTVPWLLESVALSLGAMPEPDAGAADELAHLVAEYFEGLPIDFREHVAFDWRLATGFSGDALRAIADIPFGETMSYGEVAIRAGRPRAARAVGTACRLTPFSVIVPVHRVVRSDGSVGQYGAYPERKRYLIDLEREAARAMVD